MSKASPMQLSLSIKVTLTVLLSLFAVLGNMLVVPLFFGVSFIFGSTVAMLAVPLLGTVSALIIASAAGIYTWILWGHPYALIIFALEALSVSLLYRRGMRNLVLADLLYWSVIGIPLVLILYHYAVGMGWEPATLIALKQPINGLFNTLLAGLIILAFQLSKNNFVRSQLGATQLPNLLFHVLLTSILLAGAIPLIHAAYSLREQQEAHLADSLQEQARHMERMVSQTTASDKYNLHLRLGWEHEFSGRSLALLNQDRQVLISQGELVSLSKKAGTLQELNNALSIWLPSGDLPLMKRWKQSSYLVDIPLAENSLGATRLLIEQNAAPLVTKLEAKGKALFIYLTILLLLGVIISRFLSHWLTRPLTALESVSKNLTAQIVQGLRPTLPDSRVQEYASLGNSLQDMSTHLVASFAQLKQSQENLEKLVRDRTTKLNEFTNTLDHTLDSVFIFDAATLCFTYANEGAMRQVGYSHDELISMHPYDIKPDIDKAQFITLIAPLLSGERNTLIFETVHQHKNGQRMPVEILLQYIVEEEAPPRFVATVRDISERKQAELSLRESEERFRTMLENCPTAARIALSDGFKVIFFNQRYAELLNAAPDKIVGTNPANYYVHRNVYEDVIARLARGEPIKDYLVELDVPGKGIRWTLASYFPMQYQGEAAVLGWFYDITDLKQAEASLHEQVEHTKAILNHMVDGIITIDYKGHIASFNPAAERIFGYTHDEVIGRNVKMLMPNPHRDAHDSYLRNYQVTHVARIIGIGREVEGQRKDGSLFPMDLAISEITRDGHPMYVGMVRDITERKRIEQLKNEFVSTVSHELRTPLTSISGALGLITGGALGEIPVAAKEMLNIAYKNSQRLTHLINDLLDMEKIAAGKLHFDMQIHAVMPLIEQALKANQAYGAERRVTLSLQGAKVDREIRVDSMRLMQVLSNLLSNAIKYSPESGVVEVSVTENTRQVRVNVRDHGPGIPASFRDRIFQKFSQADSSDTRQKGGTGLGLAITRELVERMGGHVGFDSVEGEGANFYFELPLWNNRSDQDMPLAYQNVDAPRILVVEDEAEVAQLLSLMLTRAGYVVDIALNGIEALAATHRISYDAMTLDLMLPDINGLEIIRQLRQRADTMSLPIVVISARIEEGTLSLNGNFPGIDWMNKPINETHLLNIVEKSLLVSSMDRPRVLHVEDDQNLHDVIRTMVGNKFDFELATTITEAKALIALERYDVIILDLSLPDGSGWDLLPEIRTLQPEARVVILSGKEMTSDEALKVESVLLKSQITPLKLLDILSTRIQSSRQKGST